MPLSRVQQRALEFLIIDKIRSEGKKSVEEIKLALLGHDPSSAPRLWPEWFPEKEVTDEEVEEVLDSSDELHFTTDETPEEMQAIIDSLTTGTMTLADIDPDDGWM